MEYKLCILIGKGRGQSFALEPDKEYTVGRHYENDITITDENISRNHFKIEIKENKYFITDLDSKNGTFVDGTDLNPGVETEVAEGIPIVIGMTILGFGETCETCLDQFLNSAGFCSELNEYGEVAYSRRVMGIKKNLEFIYKVTYALMESKDLKEISKILLENIFILFKRIDRCVIILFDQETGKVNSIIYRSRKPVKDNKKVYNKEMLKQALLMKKPVMIKDSNEIEDEYDKVTESLQLMKIRSAMCVPILSCNKIKGAIYLDTLEKPNGFRLSDASLLKDISGRVGLAIDHVSLQMTCSLS